MKPQPDPARVKEAQRRIMSGEHKPMFTPLAGKADVIISSIGR